MQKIFLVLFLAGLLSSLMAGPISELYVVQWMNGGIAVIQGNSIVRSWGTAASGEIAIAVSDTVRTAGHATGYYGAEYTKSGTFTGTTFSSTNYQNATFHDGTTDGVYNYATLWNTGQVWRYDLNWANGQMLFSTTNRLLGTTYDPTNDSLWVCGWGDGQVYNYSKSGVLLSSFSTTDGNLHHIALALDHADGTLWMSQQATNTFLQYSKTGTLLSSQTFSGFTGAAWGAEFALTNVPEPTTFALALLGLVTLWMARRRP